MVFETFNANGTHQEALAWAVTTTTGPVVEIAAGWYSTMMLHGLCEGMGRELYTVEPLDEWLEPFERYRSDWHHLIRSDDLTIPVERAGVVFIDHNHPVVTRAEVILAARPVADLVVIHDSDPGKDEVYPGVFTCFEQMQPAISVYEHRRDFRAMFPWTTVVWDGDRPGPRSVCPGCGGEDLLAAFYAVPPRGGLLCQTCGTKS